MSIFLPFKRPIHIATVLKRTGWTLDPALDAEFEADRLKHIRSDKDVSQLNLTGDGRACGLTRRVWHIGYYDADLDDDDDSQFDAALRRVVQMEKRLPIDWKRAD